MPTIEELQAEVREIQTRLAVAKDKLREAQLAVAPFKVGDVIEMRVFSRGTYKHEWVPAIVQYVSPSWGGGYTYRAARQNKDGSWSKRNQHCFSSEIRAAQ